MHTFIKVLKVLRDMQAHNYTTQRFAIRHSLSTRTIRRYIKAFKEAGYKIEKTPGYQGGPPLVTIICSEDHESLILLESYKNAA